MKTLAVGLRLLAIAFCVCPELSGNNHSSTRNGNVSQDKDVVQNKPGDDIQQQEIGNWEFYYYPGNKSDTLARSSTTRAPLTFLAINDKDDRPVTPPYGPDEMMARSVHEIDTEYLQSEWRQNWSRKTDEEKFEEALQHASRPTLVNWYEHGLYQWSELEEMKRCAARNNCEHSVLHEPIEVAEVRLNKAIRTIAKYIAKFDYGEASGEKTL